MRRLTKAEREIRSGAGIPIHRWWPIIPLFVAWGIATTERGLFQQCLGNPLDGGGRFGAVLRLVVAVPCSPLLLRGSQVDWGLFACMWVPVPFAVMNWRWSRQHKAYWAGIRQRESEARAENRRKNTSHEARIGNEN